MTVMYMANKDSFISCSSIKTLFIKMFQTFLNFSTVFICIIHYLNFVNHVNYILMFHQKIYKKLIKINRNY